MNRLLKSKTTYEAILRYTLGIIMLSYGVIKIFRTQFILPAFVYEEPLGNVDGVTLIWAFLGYSAWFSILLGFFEAIPAVLLMFRKTKVIGALLIFPVLINVFFINIAYGFFLHMRLLSAGLLMINITLLLFHYKLFKEFFIKINNFHINSKSTCLELVINALLISAVTLLIVTGFVK